MKNILIPGGCGFVGSNLAIQLKTKYPSYEIIAFDNLKRRGSELNINRLKIQGIQFVHGDIRVKGDLSSLGDIDLIIDASAEPSVMAGLDGSLDYLVQTNFNGTINCLNLAVEKSAEFIFLSTSRVYPINHLEALNYTEVQTRFKFDIQQNIAGISEAGISEAFPLDGYRSLYGASKLASELLIAEYQQFFKLKTVINRCGVITGPFQMGKVDQGVVVLWVARHFWQKGLNYIGFGGTGKQVRDMLHVNDLFDLIDFQMHNMEKVNGALYNVGGGNEVSVSLLELTQLCEEVIGNKIPIASVPETRSADIRMYVTDNTKVTNELGWSPKIGSKQIIEDIFLWIKENEDTLKPILY